MSGRLLVFLGACFTLACAPTPRTQVMVSIEAESGVMREVVRVRVSLRGGQTMLTERVDQQIGGVTEPVSLPVRVAVVPEDNDATRRFAVEATAYDARDVPLGTVRALSTFVSGRTLGLRLLLEDCCRPVTCDGDFTCRGCECVSAMVDPMMLSELGQDAGAPPLVDASAPPDASPLPDAASSDAAVSDAGPPPCVADNAITGTWAGGGSRGPLPFRGQLWARPEPDPASSSGCPALGLASGAGAVAYNTFTLCNASGAPLEIGVTMVGRASGMTPALEDPFLAVYLGEGIPADPLQCVAQNGDVDLTTRDAGLTFTMPVDGFATIVMSATLDGESGFYALDARRL